MFSREWHGLNLLDFPASGKCRDQPAGPEFYAQFYEALAARPRPDDPNWIEAKKNLGRIIEIDFLAPWTEAHGKKPRILSLGAGKGFIEQVWLQLGYDVTLQECQEWSLAEIRKSFPAAPVLIGDVAALTLERNYDIVAMLALDCALNGQDLLRTFRSARAALSSDGLLIFQSVNTLSVRQLAAESIKHADRSL